MSESLSDFGLSKALAEADENAKELIPTIKTISTVLKRIEPGLVEKGDFVTLVESATESLFPVLADDFEKRAEKIRSKQEKSSIGGLARFMRSWSGPDTGYLRFVTEKIWRGKKFKELNYKCLDPAGECSKVFEQIHSAILMSGTLVPMEMYAEILGLKKARLREYTSPFPSENRLNLVVPDVTTKFSSRGPEEYRKMARYVAEIVSATPGNSAVFFPSYALQKQIGNIIEPSLQKKFFWENPELDKEGKSKMLQEFAAARLEGAVLLGVIGGSFAEGIDYAGNLLSSIVIVGLPLESPTLEVRALIDYYDRKFKKGWDYGYIYPAMNRAMQSAGRMIRSSTDRGVVVFLDKRYDWAGYKKCFPKDFRAEITPEPHKKVREFWSRTTNLSQ